MQIIELRMEGEKEPIPEATKDHLQSILVESS